jgi:hypothetical protein
MKVKAKPLKAPPTPNDGPPKRGKIANTGSGLEATEFRGLKPEEYEAAGVFEMIVDMSPDERKAIPEHLQPVVQMVKAAEEEPEHERSIRPSWRQWRENNPRLKGWMIRKTHGSIVEVGQGHGPAVSFFTGDIAAAVNPPISDPSQPTGAMLDTYWPLTLPTRTTDPQTIALEIHWRAGLHQVRSEIAQWLEKNAPPGTPGGRVSAIVDPSAPTKGKSPFKRPASILLLIGICRILRSGSKLEDIPNWVASQSLVAHAKGKLIKEYKRILKVNPPANLRKVR